MNNFDVEWFEYELSKMVDDAKVIYEDFKNNGLSFGTVEAEGYLRAMIQIKNEFERIKNWKE